MAATASETEGRSDLARRVRGRRTPARLAMLVGAPLAGLSVLAAACGGDGHTGLPDTPTPGGSATAVTTATVAATPAVPPTLEPFPEEGITVTSNEQADDALDRVQRAIGEAPLVPTYFATSAKSLSWVSSSSAANAEGVRQFDLVFQSSRSVTLDGTSRRIRFEYLYITAPWEHEGVLVAEDASGYALYRAEATDAAGNATGAVYTALGPDASIVLSYFGEVPDTEGVLNTLATLQRRERP